MENIEGSLLEILSASIILFVVIDMIGSLPVVVAIRGKGIEVSPWKCVSVAFVLLMGFMFLGQGLLNLFNVDINSFAVAGAVVLFIIGLEMVLGTDFFKQDAPDAASIVPIAFPLMAGPGTFTTLLTLRAEYSDVNIFIAVVLNMIFAYIVLRSSRFLERLMGSGGIYVVKKFFGVILLAISVKLFATNLAILLGTAQ
ncbi:MAG: MarC family protein [Bacteroidales bacterium]|nr:MarC family protein [Bacteroidales bacterium]